MENCIFGICNNAMGERRELNPRMVDSQSLSRSASSFRSTSFALHCPPAPPPSRPRLTHLPFLGSIPSCKIPSSHLYLEQFFATTTPAAISSRLSPSDMPPPPSITTVHTGRTAAPLCSRRLSRITRPAPCLTGLAALPTSTVSLLTGLLHSHQTMFSQMPA